MKFDQRIMRLIAVGDSVSANCQPCLQINLSKARENGVSDEEIAQAIEVGKMVRQGAASKMDKFAAGLNQAALLAFVGLLILQSAFTDWCPADPFLRLLGLKRKTQGQEQPSIFDVQPEGKNP